jgi:hypothetical protein
MRRLDIAKFGYSGPAVKLVVYHTWGTEEVWIRSTIHPKS